MLLPKLPLLLSQQVCTLPCHQPRASSASGSKNHRTALYCRQADSAAAALYCFKDSAPGGREESPPRSSPQRVSGAQAADYINMRQLANLPVRPSTVFSGVRLIRAHAVTGCSVGLEIHWYQVQPFCFGARPPGGPAGPNLVPAGPATGPGMASALSRRDY